MYEVISLAATFCVITRPGLTRNSGDTPHIHRSARMNDAKFLPNPGNGPLM